MEESKAASGGSFYDLVYNAERPELFSKAAAWRVIGPGARCGSGKDANWNVRSRSSRWCCRAPARITGYTIGNDMSSRDIEGANPLYLPQAKVYDGSCAIGPAILVTDQPLVGSSAISIEIVRGGTSVFTGATTVSEMKRDFGDARGVPLWRAHLPRRRAPADRHRRHSTGRIHPQSGDDIHITVEQIGTLQNTVA